MAPKEFFSPKEIEIIGKCLILASNGHVFDEDEISIVFGLKRSELNMVAIGWPNVDLDVGRQMKWVFRAV